ncbi:MAG: DUF3363 domain-containing protein [Henriciella sp.]|nr:DUF3363 domain-containing protein [Henriciella sp.]
MSGDGDFDFQPKLGRIRSQGNFKPKGMKGYLKGARKRPSKTGGGRGSAVFTGMRRVMIKVRVHRLSGSGAGAQRAHISYLQRDGAGKDKDPAEFYDDTSDGIDGQDWLKEHADDRHHFRFIVSPEDGEKLHELKSFIRELVSQVEIDLETKLDWIAVDHYNTEHPHTHIVMSGRRDDGKDLVISKDYLSHGIRERGSAFLTRELGLQTEAELVAKLERETGLRKVTRMDRILMREMDRTGAVNLDKLRRNRPHYQKRLNTLRSMGLARHQSGGIWSVDDQLDIALNALEKSDTIAVRIEQAVRGAGLDRISAHEQGPFNYNNAVHGRLLKVGYDNELMDRRYAIVDGLDGHVHYFDLGTSFPKGLKPGDMLEIKPRSPGALGMDQTIADVAAQNRGIFSLTKHEQSDLKVSAKHLAMIKNRIAALERAGLIQRFHEEAYSIGSDFVDRVDKHLGKAAKRSPNIVRKLEGRAFESQVRAFGETWLDQQLAGQAVEPIGDAGLGGDIRSAMDDRMRRHFQRGIVNDRNTKELSDNHLKLLQKEGMLHASLDITKETGLTYRAIKPGDRIEGTFKRVHQTEHAKFAVIDRGREFSLVPWKRELEKLRDRPIEITMSRSRSIAWTIGRTRGLSR